MTTLTKEVRERLRRFRAGLPQTYATCMIFVSDLDALLDAAGECDRLDAEVGDTLNRLHAAHAELSALRTQITAGEPFDADEIDAIHASSLLFTRREQAVPDELMGAKDAEFVEGEANG